MTDWLSKISATAEGAAASGGHHRRYLEGAGDFVTSGFRTPEEVWVGGGRGLFLCFLVIFVCFGLFGVFTGRYFCTFLCFLCALCAFLCVIYAFLCVFFRV